MKKEKTINLIGMILGLAVIVLGIVLIFTPAKTYSANSVKSITFGADFYTEEYNATKVAAGNAAVTANNIRELGKKVALYVGLAFVIAGAVIELEYSKKYFCCAAACKKSAPAHPVSAPAPSYYTPAPAAPAPSYYTPAPAAPNAAPAEDDSATL